MDLKSGYPLWPVKDGLVHIYPPLTTAVTCDVAVIGGGITGALVAFHLVEAGISTIVLDKRDIGWGSTSATTALLQYEIDTPLHKLVELVGKDHAVRSYKACLDAIHKLEQLAQKLDDDSDFVRRKSLYLASRKQDVASLEKEYAIRRKHGIRLDWLSADDIQARFSFSRPAALLSYDAAQMDAYRFTHALFQKAQRNGLAIFDRTEATKFTQQKNGVQIITDRGCQVTARRIVFAAGYESQQYLKHNVAKLISTYALASEPFPAFPGWYEQCLIWESARPYFYLRTTEDNRALIGGEDEDFRDPVRRDRLLASKTKKLTKKFQALFPHLPLEVAFAWTGTFGETKDGLAYIGETPDFPHAYFALGYGGNGITYSILAAEIIRDAILGSPNPDGELFRFDR